MTSADMVKHFSVKLLMVKERVKQVIEIITSHRARSLVVSDLRSESKGPDLKVQIQKSGCWLCVEVTSLQ